jgi:3-deoxy-D-manno-octulosonate 8-phosphate phosphatase (KDO 8-P phosphatase)
MSENKAGRPALAHIRGLALDVDGVLTDGGFWWGPGGEDEWKRFSFADVMGLSLARRAGLYLALISGENSPLIDRYARKMLITHVVKGCRDKAAALRQFAEETGLRLNEICFMGDDINDVAAMELAGASFAPSSAAPIALRQAQFVTACPGGNGAVRELVDMLLEAKQLDLRDVLTRK